ncbi:hypothetical protein HO173_006749 [Letharia columbiana]|uniref:DUF7702 domain-containing protein n=1 Tax=Letharia columbiana TaxID=112416 RepID=A0A8H6FUT5_9LECA|nr:uncharacterized protein HO173_006749 [Letharia columbiana]KAF6235122.1 hypothetical protein HO173_006749 [Letharia columbiana]
MTITYRDGVAILQVVAFVPTLAFGIILAMRHGFAKSSGWVLLISFSICRLVGAICQLIAISHPSTGVYTAAIVCISIGLSPLTLICLGLLTRVNNFIPRPIPRPVFQGISIFSLAGMSLGVYGGIKASESKTPFVLNPESKTAVALFTTVFVVVLIVFVVLMAQIVYVEPGERRLLYAVAMASPLIAVRLTYGLIVDFAQNKHFSYFYGSVTIYLFMAVVPEIIACAIYIITGVTLRKLPKDDTGKHVPLDDMPGHYSPTSTTGIWPGAPMETQDQYEQPTAGSTRLQPDSPPPKRKGGGPISMLYYLGKDAYQSRRG